MKECPVCGNYTVGIDSYRGIIRCLTDFCPFVDTASFGPYRCNSLYSIDNYHPNPAFLAYVNSLSAQTEE